MSDQARDRALEAVANLPLRETEPELGRRLAAVTEAVLVEREESEATIARLRADIAELHDIVSGYDAVTDPEEYPDLHARAFRALGDEADHTICRALTESEATIATLQDENARLKAGRDSAEDELDTLKRQRDKAYADSAGLLLERNALRGENARLKAERDDAASWADLVTRGKGLCGHWKCYTYTEDPKGVRLDCLQCRAERVEAELATLKADADRREREALSHEDACVLSRIFNQYQLIQIDQYERINEFLKSLIESAFLTQRQEQSKP